MSVLLQELTDVQSSLDTRGLPIDRVGVRDLRYPICVLDKTNEKQHTIAQIALSVSLPARFKGTHMSRFLEVLNTHRGEVTAHTIPAILGDLRIRLAASSATIAAFFPYFVERHAPVTGSSGLLDYDCAFQARLDDTGMDFLIRVSVPVTSLCPCSKEISDYGAHNQRGSINVAIRPRINATGMPEMIWIEDLVELAESCASAPLYPVLKRPDERHVTMQAFDKPAFVEDIVRDVASLISRDPRISWYHVEVVNQESIHNHNAFAEIEGGIPSQSVVPSRG